VTTEEEGTRVPERRGKRDNTNTLLPDERERLKKAVQRIMSRYPPAVAQSGAARELNFSPAAINRLINGVGGSGKMVRAVAKALGVSPESILYGKEDERPVRRIRQLPGFDAALIDAQKRAMREMPGLPLSLLDKAGDAVLSPEPSVVDPLLLIAIATTANRSPDGAGSGEKRRPRKRAT